MIKLQSDRWYDGAGIFYKTRAGAT
jgi:hypothetical protein